MASKSRGGLITAGTSAPMHVMFSTEPFSIAEFQTYAAKCVKAFDTAISDLDPASLEAVDIDVCDLVEPSLVDIMRASTSHSAAAAAASRRISLQDGVSPSAIVEGNLPCVSRSRTAHQRHAWVFDRYGLVPPQLEEEQLNGRPEGGDDGQDPSGDRQFEQFEAAAHEIPLGLVALRPLGGEPQEGEPQEGEPQEEEPQEGGEPLGGEPEGRLVEGCTGGEDTMGGGVASPASAATVSSVKEAFQCTKQRMTASNSPFDGIGGLPVVSGEAMMATEDLAAGVPPQQQATSMQTAHLQQPVDVCALPAGITDGSDNDLNVGISSGDHPHGIDQTQGGGTQFSEEFFPLPLMGMSDFESFLLGMSEEDSAALGMALGEGLAVGGYQAEGRPASSSGDRPPLGTDLGLGGIWEGGYNIESWANVGGEAAPSRKPQPRRPSTKRKNTGRLSQPSLDMVPGDPTPFRSGVTAGGVASTSGDDANPGGNGSADVGSDQYKAEGEADWAWRPFKSPSFRKAAPSSSSLQHVGGVKPSPSLDSFVTLPRAPRPCVGQQASTPGMAALSQELKEIRAMLVKEWEARWGRAHQALSSCKLETASLDVLLDRAQEQMIRDPQPLLGGVEAVGKGDTAAGVPHDPGVTSASGGNAELLGGRRGEAGDLHPDEVLVNVVVSQPGRSPAVLDNLLLLGSQTVAELRDAISCVAERNISRASGPGPLLQPGGNGGSYFFFEGVLVNDTRNQRVDYSAPIIELCRSQNHCPAYLDTNRVLQPRPDPNGSDGAAPAPVPPLRTMSMEDTTLLELNVRMSQWPAYIFCHLGCCEHLVQIRDVRRVHPVDPPYRDRYPVHLSDRAHRSRRCDLCDHSAAQRVAYNDPQAPINPCFLCHGCFCMMYLDNHGNRLRPEVLVSEYFATSNSKIGNEPVGLVTAAIQGRP